MPFGYIIIITTEVVQLVHEDWADSIVVVLWRKTKTQLCENTSKVVIQTNIFLLDTSDPMQQQSKQTTLNST